MIRSKALQAGKGREEKNHLKVGGGPEGDRGRGSREIPSRNFELTHKKERVNKALLPHFCRCSFVSYLFFLRKKTSTHFPGICSPTNFYNNKHTCTHDNVTRVISHARIPFFLATARGCCSSRSECPTEEADGGRRTLSSFSSFPAVGASPPLLFSSLREGTSAPKAKRGRGECLSSQRGRGRRRPPINFRPSKKKRPPKAVS